ncbi:ABC transporter ATP-binding protein [Methanosarcina barkeri]|uniref:ABC transporter ATP-binding protein n=2 Tax=Methanosarcina barkeri TaxID=2208 RepID=A0A0G3CL07_METBA|nr:ATP-binding cassette domain-containing protein [Methanosarcina barkeri]AKB58098.1 Methionine ABC transporter ATP-binding protein [Methanosarcina barkeri 227]AKJ39817.1 ABC transporter ATP-binding protein [Methanosarcina barkeri CM1]
MSDESLNNELIKYENIGFSFENRKILSGFNLTVKKNQKILLRGKSGTGKTTLLKILLGFTKPSEGTIYFRNRVIDSKTCWEARKEIAYIVQDTDLGEGKVKSLLDEIFSYRANKEKLDHEKLRAFIRELELEDDILEKNFQELSGGEKQRIGILIALLLNRNIYLLDEVTSALDAKLKKKIADYFLAREDWTLLIVSHDREWERDGMETINIETSS